MAAHCFGERLHPRRAGKLRPRRVVETVCDAAGQVVEVKSAVATEDEGSDVRTTYTGNGLPQAPYTTLPWASATTRPGDRAEHALERDLFLEPPLQHEPELHGEGAQPVHAVGLGGPDLRRQGQPHLGGFDDLRL